jgi:hypothetical protein
VAPSLQAVYDSHSATLARFDAQGRVEADVEYNCASHLQTAALAAAGLTVTGSTFLPPLCVVEGWIAPAALPTLATAANVTRIKLPSYVRHTPRPSLKITAASPTGGAIDGNALTIMRADQFVTQAGGGGVGVTVGVQSQGVASLSAIQGRR